MDNERKVEKLIEDKWVEIQFKDIKKGDCIRLFEEDGSLVEDLNSKTELKAKSDAFINEEGVLSFVI